jgi:arabinogalactan endo-1,4-beta-galactosidase
MNRRTFLQTSALASLAMAGMSELGWERLAKGQGAPAAAKRKTPYILGADVSWLLEDEAQGAVYFDRGEQKDLLDILKSYGFNYIRARIFVNPHAPGGYAARRPEAFCDLEHTKKFAKRIKAAGMGFLLSFHYGDTWTSPGKQAKPAAWVDLPFNKLVDAVHDWTAEVMKGLKENGTPPQMVSIGNETTDGMLFPDGRSSNFDNYAMLTNAGCRAVRESNPTIKTAVHSHLGRDNAAVTKWMDNFLSRKTDIDIIGMSCYNEAHEGDWQNNFNDLAVRYPQLAFLAMEYSYEKRRLNDLIFNAPNEKGLGSFIWEPTRWREAIFDHNGQNAGNDDRGRPHLPASTLPAAGAADQPIYRPARPPAVSDAGGGRGATRPAPGFAGGTTGPGTRPGFGRGNGGRYDTNSYILAYPEMAKAYGL